MTIIAILLKASLLLATAVLAQALIGKHLSATSRHLLWTLAIVGLLVLPLFYGMSPTWTLARVTPSRAPEFARMAESAVTRFASEMTSSLSAPVGSGDRQLPGVRISWSTVASVVYGVGLLAFLLRLVAQRWSVRRLVHRATRIRDPIWNRLIDETARSLNFRRSIVLLRGLEETMPMAFGTRRPAILLPAVADTWSEDQRRSVLLHELAHVARHDCLTQSLAAVACAMYWPHPGVWWVARRLRIERELACDDRVLATGADPDDYASHLLDFAYSLHVDTAPALAVTMAAPASLEGRLRALLDRGRNRRRPALRSCLAATGMVVLLVGAIATARLDAIRVLVQIEDSPRQSFAVASVKPNKSPETGGFIQRRPGGSFSVGNQTLQTLILFAYGIRGFQLVGAPDWIAKERFDIVARASGDVPPTRFGQTAPEALMLRSLLEDRFRLSVHRDTRELPIYSLVLARADGRPGPRLRRPNSDYCAKQFEAAGKPGAASPPEGSPICGINGGNSELTAGSFPMNAFAMFLSGTAGRIVVDRTGLTGEWDFDLKWSPPNAPAPDPDRPSIFTALQEQLGLRLRRRPAQWRSW
jgi:uncharacterized protein (TIGR03435 family)